MNESTKWLYEKLSSHGYNVGASADIFDSLMVNNPESRKWAYNTAQKHGYNVGEYDMFERLVGAMTDGLKTSESGSVVVSPTEAKENTDSINQFLENRDTLYTGLQDYNTGIVSGEEQRRIDKAAADAEAQAEAVRQRLQEDGTIDRMKESKKDARRDKLRAFGSMLGSTPQVTSFGVSSNVFDSTEEQLADVGQAIDAGTEYRQNKLLQEKLDVALDMARAGENQDGLRGVENFGLGLWDSATRLSTWDFGASDIVNNLTLMQIVEKWENDPSSLTATEQKVLEGIGMATAVQELYADQVGIGYNVGQSLPESAGFMASMALNPASGLGKSLARNAVRTYGRNSIAKNLARIGGDIAETAIMTATTGAGRVAADALERINGSSTYEIGENGVIMYGGQKDQETVGNAVIKAIGSNFIENYSEALGEYFDPLLGMSRKVAAGGLRKMNLNKWADALSDVQPSQMTASIRSLREKTKFGGIFGEVMEEEIGMALNAISGVGDYTFSKEKAEKEGKQWIFDLENQLTTVLSCAIMSGTLNGVEQVSNVAARRRMEKNAKNAEQEASYRFHRDEFASLREAIDQASPEGMVDVLRDVYMSQEYTVGQKRALAEYAAARLQLQYYNAADAKARRQVNKTQQELLDAQEAGLNAQLPQFFNIARAAQFAEDELLDYDGDWNLVDIIRSSMNRPEEMERILGDLPPREAQLVTNYIYSRARMEGAYQGRSNRAEDYIDDFAYALEPAVVTDTEGNRTITTALLGDRSVYVLENNGDLAHIMRPDGSKILVKASELTNITTSSAEEVIDRYRDMYTFEYNAETEGAFEHHPKTQAPQVGLQLQSPEGEVVITAINDNMVEIVPAVYKDGQVQPKEGAEPRTITVDDAYAWQDDYYLSMDADQAYANAMAEANNMSAETAENESTPTEGIEQSVSEEVTDGQNSTQPTETESVASVAPAAPQTARERVPKDDKGNPIYEQTDADTAWDAIVEETEGDTEMAQRVAVDMLADKKAALVKLQNGKPKKGSTVAEKIANEKAHQAAIAQAQNDVAQWEAIVGTEARRREAAMSEADRYAAEMEQKSINEGLTALGEPQSLEEYVLGQLAGGAYKLRWSDKENGTKGFGSHTGLSTEEMKARLSMIDNKNGLTPEEIAHSIVENMDASFGEVDVMDVTNMVIDAVATHASRRAMLNGMVESRAELIRQQARAEQEAKDAWYMEQYHATEEELAAYNEYLAEFAEEIYGEDTDYEQRIATFAEIQLGYDNQGADAGLRSSANQGEGLASDREGGRSVGETEQLNQREVLGDAAGVAAPEDQGAGSSVSAQSDDRQARIDRAVADYRENVDDSPEAIAAAERDQQRYEADMAEDAAETVETLENGDVRRTNRNSNGEIATVAIERDGKVVSVDTYEDGALFERTDYDANGNATKVTRYKDGEVVSEQEYKDGKRKVTANVFEMAEEAQKKRKSKKKNNDKLAEKNHQQKENRSETRGVGNRPQLQDDQRYESFIGRLKRLIIGYKGTTPTEEVAKIIRDFNNGKTLLARTEQERELLKMLRVMTNQDIDYVLSEIEDVLSFDAINEDDRKKYEDAVSLINKFKNRGERKVIIRGLTGAELGDKLPLTKIDELFEMYNSDADVAELYGRVRVIAEQIGLDFWFDDNMDDEQTGGYLDVDNRVRLNAHMLYSPYVTQQEKASVIVHEILHAVADYAINTQKDIKLGLKPSVQLPKQVLSAANSILNIYEKVVKGNPLLVHEEYDPVEDAMKVVPDYGTSSAREMLMEIANPEFRDKLKQIEYNGRSVWQRIWDAIKSMFTKSSDVSNPTAYDSMAKALDVLINEFSVDAYQKYSGLEENAARVYHGSGALFDKFDHSFMGTGEGNQAFGWGTYVSEAEGVGKTYAKIAAKPSLTYKGQEVSTDGYENPWRVIKDLYDMSRGKITQMRADAEKYGRLAEDDSPLKPIWGEIVAILKNARRGDIKVTPRRMLYEVEIPDDNGSNYLEWYDVVDRKNEIRNRLYERLAEGQGETYKTELKQELYDVFRFSDNNGRTLYKNISAYLGGDKAASQFLHEMGYVGIKYPTNTLHGGNIDGTSNYVIFNEDDLEIVDNLRFRDGAPFFSNAERAVENIKQQKATPEQWLAMIKKDGGLKAGEDKWMGLSDWLTEQKEKGAKTLTKDEVLQFIRENQIEIEEVEYNSNPQSFEDLKEEYEELLREEGSDAAHDIMVDRFGDDFDIAFDDLGGELTIADEEAAATLLGSGNIINSTRLDYTTEGLENKKEIAFVVPSIEPWNQTDAIHFGDAGEGRAVAWVRFGETIDEDGKRVLVIDEVQSKRHDEGRAKGYKSEARLKELDREYDKLIRERAALTNEITASEGVYNNETMRLRAELGLVGSDEQVARYIEIDERLYEVSSEQRRLRNAIPDAPFDKNYHELVMKRMLRYAAENGFDKVAWTKGAQQAERYDIGASAKKIIVEPYSSGREVRVVKPNGYADILIFDKNGISHENHYDGAINGKSLQEVFGKDLGSRIQSATEKQTFEGVDLYIGGEGMKGFYDRMLPSFMNKYTKKWGTKVGEVTLPNVEEAGRTMWSVDVTPEMRESVMQGQPMFREGMGAISDREVSYENDPIAKWQGKPRYYGKRAAAFAERERARMQKGAEEAAKILGIEVEIITDASSLKGRKAKAKGWYDINSKKVVVVVPNHVSKGDAVRTVLHEGVAHHGLRELFGDGFDAMLDNIYNNVAPELKARIDAIAERTGVSTSVATEEYMASLAETTNFEEAQRRGWWQKIKSYFVDMLRKLSMPGLKLKEELTDNELRYLLWRSYQNLVAPDSYLKPLGYLDDVAKQKELKVGDYAENTMATPSAAEGGNTPYGRENPYYNKKKSTRAQRDEIVKSIIRKGYNSVGTDVIKVGDYLFLIDHMDNEDFLNLFEGRKIPDGYGYGIRKKYNFAELTKDDIYEIVRNIAESYNYNEESIRDWLQELGLESRDLLELDIASELRGGDRDYGVGIGAGGGRRDKVDSNTSSSDSGKDKGEVVGEESEIRYRLVDDQAEIERLESEPTIKAYRAMQVINGELYPPMSAVVDGKLREPIALGQWEQSEERPDLADDNGRFKLDKGNKKSLKAAYNPYFHSSSTPLNDQFSEAQDRDNLVTVEVEVPVSEADGTSGYKAEKAKDAVGTHQWKAGIIQGQLTGKREVFLTRWDKPIRIVPESEVADVIVEMFDGKDIVMPSNVVTPQLRKELEARGIAFVETDNQGKLVEGEHKGEHYSKVYGKKSTNKSNNKAEIIAEVERESVALGVPVRIARSVDELPDADTRKRAVDGKLKGYYDPRTNEVVLYAPNTDDANDAKRTILHEIVGHKGLRQLIGEERYDKAMVQLMYMLPSEVRDAVLRRAERHGWNAAIAMDEYLAEQAERDVQPTWWGKVNAKIRALLRNMGFDVKLTDADVTYLLWRSRKKLQGDSLNDMATNAILKRAARKSAEAEAWNEQAFKDAEMRDFESNALPSIRHRMGADTNDYEKAVRTLGFKQAEAWQDSMRSLLVFQQALAKASGKDISDFENAYMYENRMSSANLMEMEQYRHMVYNPLLKEIHELEQMGASRESIINYLFAKSGLERNEVFARRDAKKHAEGDASKEQQLYDKYRQKDYAGLTALTRGDAQIAALADDHSKKKTEYERLEQNKKRGVGVSDADLKAAKKEMNDARKAMITAIEAETQRMVDEFEAQHNTDNLWDKIRNCTHTTLDISHDAGVMSDEVYNELWNQFQYYIPLRGFAETTAEDVYLYLGGNDSPYNAPIKTAYGRTSLADDPIATIGNMAESAIVEANRNRLKQRFLYMVERHNTDLASISDVWLEYDDVNDEWHTVFAQIPDDAAPSEAKRLQQEFEDRMKTLAEQNPGKYANASQQPNIPYRVVKKGDRQEHHVIVKRNGKDVVITINGNPRVAQAINGLTNPEQNQGMITRITSWINRNLSANFTMRNPAFMVSNFVRDGFYTNSMVWVKENPAYAWQYNQNWAICTAQIASLVKRYKRYEKGDTSALDMNNDMDRMFYEFMINGGETGYTVIKSVEDYKGLISGEMKKMEAGAMGTARRVADTIGNVVDTFGRWAEDTSRFAAYMTSRQLGRTITKSIWDAKEISVNFNKKGSGNRMMGKFEQGNRWNYVLSNMSQLGRNLYVFWNAGMQGLNNFKNAAKKSPAKFTAMAGTYFTLGVIVAAAFSGDDDEDDYYNLPEYVRRNNICFKIGKGKYATLPLPIEIRAIYGLGELAYSYLSGKEGLTHGETVTKTIQQMTQIMPIDMMADGGGAMALVPSAAKPVVEVIHNVDWTGRPIYKEKTPWNQNDPTWTLAFKSTSPELVGMSRLVNEWTNKNTADGLERPYNRGWADNRYLNNPAVWEHIAEGYLGGVATMFNQTKKTLMMPFNEDLREVRNVPIASRFIKDAGKEGRSYAARNEYYDAKNIMDSWKNEMSKAKKEVLDESLTDEQRLKAAKLRSSLEQQYMEAAERWKVLDRQRKALEEAYKNDQSEENRQALDDVMMQMATLVEAYRD